MTDLAKFFNMLKPYAVQNTDSKGRRHMEVLDDERTPFQLDRDRILHSRAWRRMEGKTQVFVVGYGDHYRNRMTHSLEVAQISRDLARWLGLNEDLAESIALAHDLGHTPFGHAGEHALNECLQAQGLSFEHNEQSRRTVEELELVYPNFPGLNLSLEVIEGLMKHHTSWDNPVGGDSIQPSIEAQVVNLADEIAYQNHDIDDGLRSELFTEKDLREVSLWEQAREEVNYKYGELNDEKIRRSRIISHMMSLMIKDVHDETERRLSLNKINNLEDVYTCKEALVDFSTEMRSHNTQLKEFLMNRLYFHPEVSGLSQQGQKIIHALYQHYLSQGMEPAALKDYLAGMTDRFAEFQVKELGGLQL
ncbi:MAG: dGTPase [Oceanicoccus sp.]|jgi:dGTPase